jgi:hypothetical protein
MRRGQDTAKPVEPVLIFYRVDEMLQAFFETWIAEVGQASDAPAGPIHQGVLAESQRVGPCEASAAVAEIHDPDR